MALALNDLNASIDVALENAEYLHVRGDLHNKLSESTLAMEDFNGVIQLDARYSLWGSRHFDPYISRARTSLIWGTLSKFLMI